MGFISDLLAVKNNFKSDPNQVKQNDYATSIRNYLSNLSQSQAPGQQQNLANTLEQQIQGGGPNLGQTQLQAATDRNNQQAASMLASQRAINPALAARQILQQQAQNNQGAANQSAQLQQQQQLAAQQQLGDLTGQIRNQDVNQIGTLGQLDQGQNQNYLQSQGLNLNAQLANQNAANNVTGGLLGGLGTVGATALGAPVKKAEGGYIEMRDQGGHVPGEAKVEGDSPKNDTVHALLSPGEIVIPRTIAQDPERAKEFIEAIHAHKEEPKKREKGYGKVLQAKRNRDRLEE